MESNGCHSFALADSSGTTKIHGNPAALMHPMTAYAVRNVIWPITQDTRLEIRARSDDRINNQLFLYRREKNSGAENERVDFHRSSNDFPSIRPAASSRETGTSR